MKCLVMVRWLSESLRWGRGAELGLANVIGLPDEVIVLLDENAYKEGASWSKLPLPFKPSIRIVDRRVHQWVHHNSGSIALAYCCHS